MFVAKFIICVVLASFAHIVSFVLMDRLGEIKIFRRLIVSSVAVKFLLAVIVYLLFPQIAGKTSDAGLFYLPEAKHVLEGQLPYRDFASSYSVLFPVVLAPAVAVWRSIGAVVLVMLIFESLMASRKNWRNFWR